MTQETEELEQWSYRDSNLSFSVDRKTVQMLDILQSKTVDKVTLQVLEEIVFVTASSENHFRESIDAVASVQEVYPGVRIMYYDIGLNSYSVSKVNSIFSTTRKIVFTVKRDLSPQCRNSFILSNVVVYSNSLYYMHLMYESSNI